jgi:hypothetical protein
MRQGTASSVPETWTRYSSLNEARAGARHMYHDDRVLRVMLASMVRGLLSMDQALI